MIQIQRDAVRIALALGLAIYPLTGQAQGQGQSQSGSGWFVPDPSKQGGAAPRGPQTPPSRALGAEAPAGMPPAAMQAGPDNMHPMVEAPGSLPPLQVPLPPMPDIPPIPKGSPTPAAIVGILSVPDILRVSSAYQQADRELALRKNRLNDDAQKEQNTLRDLGQAFATERGKLTPEQIRNREKDYADRVNESRRKFSERARIIQEAGQYVMQQIERVIEQVAQQVAASRGVNLVLNRGQVLGTTVDFELTPQVAEMLNKVLPAVIIPPDGVSPTKFATPAAGPRANAVPDATPAKKN